MCVKIQISDCVNCFYSIGTFYSTTNHNCVGSVPNLSKNVRILYPHYFADTSPFS